MNPNNNILYSVVVPVYNGASSLEELFFRTQAVFKKNAHLFEIIFVDDFSLDNSWDVIKKLKDNFPEIVNGIKLSKNFGQHGATMCGFFHSKGDFIITIDDDLDFSPESIDFLLEDYNKTGSDLIYGVPRKTKKISFRSFLTKLYIGFSKIEGTKKGRGSSFRLMSKKLIERIKGNANNFVLIDEICLWYTNNISFIEVENPEGKRKKSRYSLNSLFNLAGNQIIFSSTFPLKLMTYFGTFVAIVNFLIGIKFIYRKMIFNVPLGYTSVIVSILFSTGIILICLGIIGKYLGRVLRATNNVPAFCVEQKI